MSEEALHKKSEEKEKAAPAAAHEGPGGKADAPERKAAGGGLPKKWLLVIAAVTVVEAAGFSVFLLKRGGGHDDPHAEAETKADGKEAGEEFDLEKDYKEYEKVKRHVMEIGEIKVPIQSTQPRAPRSITASFQVVVNEELNHMLSGAAGGHGGGGKKISPQKQVLLLNIRSILMGMMETYGARLVEPNAKAEFVRRAKDRLNHVKIDGDEEKAQVLRILRGQVLQVIIDRFDVQSF